MPIQVYPEQRRPTCSHLYRYSSLDNPEWLQKIVLEHELYIPSVAQLNDPADGRPLIIPMSHDEMVFFLFHKNYYPIRSIEEARKKLAILEGQVRLLGPEQLSRKCSEQLNQLSEGHRVYSMSKRFDNLSMWAKYAKEHTGYCLEFAREGKFFEAAVEVIYGDVIPIDVYNPKASFLFCKRQEWSNEEEVRVIVIRGGPSTVKIEPRLLTRIILGKNTSAAHEKLIREWATVREPTLEVVKSQFDEASQKLVLK